MPKCDCDFLGRWQAGAHQSTEYVVKAREVVFRVQKGVTAALCQGHDAVNEHELFDDLKKFCLEREVSLVRGLWSHQVWRKNAEGQFHLRAVYPLLVTALVANAGAEAAADVVAEPAVEPSQGKSWYSVSRRPGFRRLHLVNGCGVLPWNVFEAVYVSSIEEAKADAWCKTCQKRLSESAEQGSSASGSSSSAESEAPKANSGSSSVRRSTFCAGLMEALGVL